MMECTLTQQVFYIQKIRMRESIELALSHLHLVFSMVEHSQPYPGIEGAALPHTLSNAEIGQAGGLLEERKHLFTYLMSSLISSEQVQDRVYGASSTDPNLLPCPNHPVSASVLSSSCSFANGIAFTCIDSYQSRPIIGRTGLFTSAATHKSLQTCFTAHLQWLALVQHHNGIESPILCTLF